MHLVRSTVRLPGESTWSIARTGRFSPAIVLAFAEAVTLVAADHVPDEVYAEAAEHYSGEEIAALVSLLVVINAWNRIGVSTRAWTPVS
jgi:alkylhydroperoxidase family enzyme